MDLILERLNPRLFSLLTEPDESQLSETEVINNKRTAEIQSSCTGSHPENELFSISGRVQTARRPATG